MIRVWLPNSLKTHENTGQNTVNYVWVVMANLIFELDYSDKYNPDPSVFKPLDRLYDINNMI